MDIGVVVVLGRGRKEESSAAVQSSVVATHAVAIVTLEVSIRWFDQVGSAPLPPILYCDD